MWMEAGMLSEGKINARCQQTQTLFNSNFNNRLFVRDEIHRLVYFDNSIMINLSGEASAKRIKLPVLNGDLMLFSFFLFVAASLNIKYLHSFPSRLGCRRTDPTSETKTEQEPWQLMMCASHT